jgi:hypothetical protein
MRKLWLLIGTLLVGAAQASPLFVQRYETAQPGDEAVAKALEQVREHKEVKIIDKLKVPPFHKQLTPGVTEGEAYCQGCHLPVPHTKHLRTRAFLNMHSRYIACETCHFRPKDVNLNYRWLDYTRQKAAPVEGRLRTGEAIDNGQAMTGSVKIAPFAGEEPAIAFPGSEFAQRIAQTWKDSDENGKARLKAKLHAPLEKEGPACAKCHTEQKPMLDLTALGAPPEQARSIQRHVIPQFFGRYKADDERLKIIDILQ